MKILHISDSHHAQPKLPSADLLIHSGDLTSRGTLLQVDRELKWLGSICNNYKYGVLLVPGNHDFLFDKDAVRARVMCEINGVRLLINESIYLEGLRIYGSPYQPQFYNWAFNCLSWELAENWAKVPHDTDILITHCPPLGILDQTPRDRAGCRDLTDRVRQLPQLKYHLFGHIHEDAGHQRAFNIDFINASILDERYQRYQNGYMIDTDARTVTAVELKDE